MEENLRVWLSMTANKYEHLIDQEGLLQKDLKDCSFCKVIVDLAHPFAIQYSKTLEIVRVTFFYGFWNIFGIPQHVFA